MPRLRPLNPEALARLWGQLLSVVKNHNGNVVSVPNAFPMRIEVKPVSTGLLNMLDSLGYPPKFVGIVERLMPTGDSNQVGGIDVEIYEINL
jgi:hypothetical protein